MRLTALSSLRFSSTTPTPQLSQAQSDYANDIISHLEAIRRHTPLPSSEVQAAYNMGRRDILTSISASAFRVALTEPVMSLADQIPVLERVRLSLNA